MEEFPVHSMLILPFPFFNNRVFLELIFLLFDGPMLKINLKNKK
jgi:hypothetical protein